MLTQTSSPLKRIGVFFDGSFTMKVSNYYRHLHIRGSYIQFAGLHEFIRFHVAERETDHNVSLCQIVESHFFRGRSSLNAIQNTPDTQHQLESDRFLDQLLMHAGIVAHYFPMAENTMPPTEKGMDVWFAMEVYDLAVHKHLDVVAILSGNQDFIPLVKKLNGLGTRVMIIGINTPSVNTAQKLMDEASYTVMLNEEIDSKKGKVDTLVDGLFV